MCALLWLTLLASAESRAGTVPAVAARGFRVVVDGPLIEKSNGWHGAVFTPDGRRIIHHGLIYDAKTAALLRRITGCAGVLAISAVSPDRKTVAFRTGYRGSDKTPQWRRVSVASVETGRILKTVEIVDRIEWISFPSQRRVVAGAAGSMYVIDPQLGRVIRVDKHAKDGHTAVSPDGKLYAKSHSMSRLVKGVAGKSDSTSTRFFVTIHDLETGKETARLGETEGFASRMMWTPDGEHIITTAPSLQMNVFHVPTRKLLATHVEAWEPGLARQMVDRRFLVIENGRRSAFLDLKTQEILPIKAPAEGQVQIVAISPDGTRVVVARYGLPAGRVSVYLARLERIRAPGRPAAHPVLGGTPVKGLRVSLAAKPDVFLTGFSIGQLDLTVTFTNVSDRPIKWTRWTLRYVPRLIGPDGRSLTPRKGINKAHFIGPREADVKTLAPGGNISFILKEFPRFIQGNDEDHFDLSKPGRYRLRLTYTSKLGSPNWPAGFKECWQGTVTTNEVAIDVMNAQDKGPRPVGPLVRMLRFEKHPLWAARNLARDAKAGLPAVTAVFEGTEHWTVRVRAAGGLMDAESKASPDLKRKAEMFLLKSLTSDYTAAGLRGPGFYLRPTDEGLRWLLDRAGKAGASRILRRQAMGLLFVRTERLGPGARRLFLGGLAGTAIETRRYAMTGLGHLGLKEGELALYRRLANDADLVVRRRLFQALAHTPGPWVMPLLIAGLQSDDEDVRRACTWGIRNRKGQPATRPAGATEK